jgi:hypothetical protein
MSGYATYQASGREFVKTTAFFILHLSKVLRRAIATAIPEPIQSSGSSDSMSKR